MSIIDVKPLGFSELVQLHQWFEAEMTVEHLSLFARFRETVVRVENMEQVLQSRSRSSCSTLPSTYLLNVVWFLSFKFMTRAESFSGCSKEPAEFMRRFEGFCQQRLTGPLHRRRPGSATTAQSSAIEVEPRRAVRFTWWLPSIRFLSFLAF